jgi:DNA-binding transcriptional LysR family regulator
LPDFVVCNAIIEKRLISIFDGAIQNAGTFRILWPSSRYMSPKLRVFVDFMADHLFSKVDQCDAKAVLAR